MSIPKWKIEQKLCEKHNLRQCSMNRCCNALLIDKLVDENRLLKQSTLRTLIKTILIRINKE